jgi:hypothetical protein
MSLLEPAVVRRDQADRVEALGVGRQRGRAGPVERIRRIKGGGESLVHDRELWRRAEEADAGVRGRKVDGEVTCARRAAGDAGAPVVLRQCDPARQRCEDEKHLTCDE